ncbi:hypothetical protein CEXT_728921 [Caerostris extrusa]|uniref:Uncharacterized protein n=1 Tax=Caerostris extrusa TaxID=172846 RepID=A0AAV4PTI6_CAEEX|nr:hypothetical protein CEXT_728921 [Caerostris extrusa]
MHKTELKSLLKVLCKNILLLIKIIHAPLVQYPEAPNASDLLSRECLKNHSSPQTYHLPDDDEIILLILSSSYEELSQDVALCNFSRKSLMIGESLWSDTDLFFFY